MKAEAGGKGAGVCEGGGALLIRSGGAHLYICSRGSGTLLLDRGWTLFFSGVAQAVRCRAGVEILISPLMSADECCYFGVH